MQYTIESLSKHLAKTNEAFFAYEYKDFLKIFCSEVEKLVQNGDTINLDSFGKFEPKFIRAKTAMHPKTGEKIEVPAAQTLTFKPSRSMIARLKEKNVDDKQLNLELNND